MSLRFAQVVAVRPQSRTVELCYSDDGWREADVPVLCDYVSTDTGAWSQHNVARPPTELLAGGVNPTKDKRTVFALVATVEGRSVVVGFIPEPLSQIMFIEQQQDRDMVWRHPSGTLVTIAPSGSLEVQHTGGAYLRIATDHDSAPPDQHEDLTPFGANENWALPKNDPPWITLCTQSFKATVKPGGDTTIESGGNLTVQYVGDALVELGGNLTAKVNGSAYVSAGGAVSVQTPDSVTVTAGGDATVQAVGNASLSAGGDATVSADGSASVDAGGDASLQAGGDATVAAVGSVTVAAGGSATVGAVGDVMIGAAGTITMTAPEITADTAVFTVVGTVVELDQWAAGALSGAAGGAAIGAIGAAQGAAGAATAFAASAKAPPVAARAAADAAQATSDTNAAKARADIASQAAQGSVPRITP